MPHFKTLLIYEEDGNFRRAIEQRHTDELPEGDVLIRVHHAGLNYKDALSATGNKGVTRKYPHTPGIDASGVVEESSDARFSAGQKVIVTSYDLGMNTDGAFGEFIRVPAGWVVPLPDALSLKQSMILGTAGFTAALALYKMELCGQSPEMGKIVVTGATGGVGSMAVAILAKAGYEVIASTGKESEHAYLKQLGAVEAVGRSVVDDDSGRPLLRPQWAGGIDTVGGNTLATLLKGCGRNGSIATCGLVASPKLNTTVFPFILNGVNLLGVDSAETPRDIRHHLWQKLASDWNISAHLEAMCTDASLEELNDKYIDMILAGKTRGRVVVSF
ncbi:MAG: YhdH/YhfP family quinone oxidoreductase [Bacteroidia bacterium]